jgi:hypothetical protein
MAAQTECSDALTLVFSIISVQSMEARRVNNGLLQLLKMRA